MTAEEVWLPVPGTAGRYEVSNLGSFRKHYKRGPHIMPGFRNANGYFVVSINGARKLRHVLVATAFYGPAAQGQVCRHLNGVAGDDRIENLQWGTQKENAEDSKRHGTNYALNKTECKWGHEFTEANTFIDNLGRRICRTCKLRHGQRETELIAARRRAGRIASWTARPDRVVHGRLDSGELLVGYRCPGPRYYRENLTTGKRVHLSAAELHLLIAQCQRGAA